MPVPVPEGDGHKTAARLCYSTPRGTRLRAWLVSVKVVTACKVQYLRGGRAHASIGRGSSGVTSSVCAMALTGWPIAMAHHIFSPELVIVDLHRKAGKIQPPAAGRPPSVSRVVPPPDSSVASKTAAKAIWQRRKKHSMHEQ